MGHRSRGSQAAAPSEQFQSSEHVDRASWETVAVTDALVGQRLDRALAELRPDLSRTRAQTAIKAGEVTVNGKLAKPSLTLEAEDRLALAPTLGHDAAREALAAPQAEAIPLRVIYEDAHLLIIDKPAGLVTHPAPGHATGTLVNALLAHTPELGDQEESDNPQRPGIVHRLDKDTSGLLVIAKDARTHTALAEQMRERAMVKRYTVMVEGHVEPPSGVIDAPIGRDPRNRLRMALVTVEHGGRDARTRFHTVRYLRGGRSLLEAQLETGRTHQIRVHLAAVHHPVVGDLTYGRPQNPMPPRQFLHAAHLEFRHPITQEWLIFDAPLPDDLATFLRTLEEPAARQTERDTPVGD
ncbi:MAG TPA: RluA family pseudouridine synthase [Ktedonobacterales bacterium]|nr:RluA family pseudouridine synthase [Ktedonobacterales bacterium]